MTADLYSFAIPFMADRSSVFPFDSEKRLGSFFLGVSPVGKPQKRKMSQQPFFFWPISPSLELGCGLSLLGTGHGESGWEASWMEEGLRSSQGL